MKNYALSILLVVLCTLMTNAQHKGNYDQISRQNILHSGNATIYNPTVQQQINKVLSPSTSVFIDVKALQNVEATTYTAIFNVSQIGATADSTNLLMNERIDKVKNQLKSLGITEDNFAIDVISFVPNYEIEIQKKLFSKTYTEVPNGFELQQNLHIQFTKTNQFESILTACAKSEIYNLIKVDYYIENIAEVYKNLQTKLLKLIEEKKAYYKVLGFDLANYNVAIADDQYCYFPKDFYQSYQAFNSVSFEAIKKKKGVTSAKKQTSYYYQPLSYENYDVVVNPSILEPVVQIGMNIRLQYTPKPIEEGPKPIVKTEIKHKYYVVSPNGTLDIKALNTNN
ncbi:SIMPL domain-containing protein [uncultured Psychroserpens sp.]|uniref:SIMPL domain-containing protein n=1 Tax=uncultured Psychroserpens sp. TaxID=255436 RepID=UPI0026298431|nr:SIMPL domain-containing protein [uncultured Psychroserpens sp.]